MGNCPYCRAEPSEKERLVAVPVDSDNDSDSDSGSDSEVVSGVTPLMNAISEGLTTEVARLIAEGANIEEADSDGDTALIYAAMHNDDDCAAILIAAGADIKALAKLVVDGSIAPANTMSTALMGACRYNMAPCVAATLAAGADPNYAHPITGITPLMEAVRYDGDQEVVDMLLAKGASIYPIDADGWNVFMWFAEGAGDVDIMASLLSAAGPLLSTRESHSSAAKKIQALWRGWTMRRQQRTRIIIPRFIEPTNWFMNRMTAVV